MPPRNNTHAACFVPIFLATVKRAHFPCGRGGDLPRIAPACDSQAPHRRANRQIITAPKLTCLPKDYKRGLHGHFPTEHLQHHDDVFVG